MTAAPQTYDTYHAKETFILFCGSPHEAQKTRELMVHCLQWMTKAIHFVAKVLKS